MQESRFVLRQKSEENRNRLGFPSGTYAIRRADGKTYPSVSLQEEMDAVSILRALREAGIPLPHKKSLVYFTEERGTFHVLGRDGSPYLTLCQKT